MSLIVSLTEHWMKKIVIIGKNLRIYSLIILADVMLL